MNLSDFTRDNHLTFSSQSLDDVFNGLFHSVRRFIKGLGAGRRFEYSPASADAGPSSEAEIR